MALYTLKSTDEALSPYGGLEGYYRALGRNTGTTGGNTTASSKYATTNVSPDENDNFLVSRLKDIGNAIGTSASALFNTIKSGNDWLGIKGTETITTENQLKAGREKLNSIAKEYGYESYKDALGDTNAPSELITKLQNQSAANSEAMNTKAAEFKDYAQNNEMSKLINQDPGKFAGSAINTLSTAFDVMAPGAGVAANFVQGGLEGLADELRYSGLENFDWGNAAQRAGIGAATGAATGMLNKGINNAVANNASGSVLKGSNDFTKAINKFDTALNKNTAGIAGAAARGAATGAVGGGIGGGLSAALNGGNVIGGTVQGALSGARQGAAMGGTFGAINAGANAIKNQKAANAGNVDTTQATQQATAAEPVEVEGKDITSAFAMNETPIEKTNKAQSIGKQIKNVSESIKHSDLYGNLDASTAKRAVETQAPQTLTKLGVKPQDYAEYAKTSNYVNKVVSDLAEESGVKVNAPDLMSKLSLDNSDAIMTDNATKKYNTIISQIVADGDSPTEYSASYLLEKSREIGNKAANLRGNTDDVKTLRTALNEAKWTLRDLANNSLETSGITGDLTTDNIAKGLKQLGANEDVIDYYTQATADGKAPTAADFIKRSSLFEQARDMGTQYQSEKLTRSASKEPTNPATQAWNASGLNQLTNTVLKNTVSPVAGGVAKAAGSLIEGAGTLGSKIGKAASAISESAPTDISTQVFNTIGRETGQTNANDYIDAAAQATTLEDLAGTTGTTDLANLGSTGTTGTSNLYTTTGTTTTQTGKASAIFGNTGNSQLDLIARAMDIAVGNNDANAFGQLYEMYMSMASNLEESSTSSTKLTATQQRANAAMDALEELASLTPDTGYALSDIPLIGSIATLGGNTYDAAATNLLQQIGYMQSGANIKDDEIALIKQSYIPQPWDSEATRKQKLERARKLIEQYQNGYMTSSDAA